ncbi:MAG: hypothetical protein ACI841_000033 [Planctomycetota bacterium]|jgi:hypothetical protein
MSLPALTTAALLLVPQLPRELTPPPALAGLNVEVQVQVTGTHFLAENHSTNQQIIMFGATNGQPTTTLRLAPGASLTFPFPRGSADELSIEVISIAPQGWTNTGALDLESIRESEGAAMWITRVGSNSIGWIETEHQIEHSAPIGGLAPEALIRTGGASMHNYANRSLNLNFAATQVPAVTPRPVTGAKPKIKKKPLSLM